MGNQEDCWVSGGSKDHGLVIKTNKKEGIERFCMLSLLEDGLIDMSKAWYVTCYAGVTNLGLSR